MRLKIRLVGFGEGTENAGDFFHGESLTERPPFAQEIFNARNAREAGFGRDKTRAGGRFSSGARAGRK